jgi:hypothetical protein
MAYLLSPPHVYALHGTAYLPWYDYYMLFGVSTGGFFSKSRSKELNLVTRLFTPQEPVAKPPGFCNSPEV